MKNPYNHLPTIRDIKSLKGKRVIVRVDFNVPTKNGKILEPMRIARALPTIEYLVKKKAKVILLSHIGNDGTTSLKPVARYLEKKLSIGFVPHIDTERLKEIVERLPEGGVMLCENTRTDPREISNDTSFARALASLGDVYVNDAFGVSHRKHATVVGIPRYLPSYVGFLVAEEVKELSRALTPEHPFVFILGGAKFPTKAPLMKKFLSLADYVVVGGVLANNFLKDMGYEVGASVVDVYPKGSLAKLLKTKKILLPTDVLVEQGKKKFVRAIDLVEKGDKIVDLGPETIKHLSPLVRSAKLVVWNGPLGYYEGGYDKATSVLLEILAESKARSIIGGGDTAVLVESLSLGDKLSFVSTGGGATLDFLSAGKLPGVDAILSSKQR